MHTAWRHPRPSGAAGTHARGVTFVELLVTIAVIAIVAAIATPALTGFAERQRLRSATEHVLAAVNTARAEAQRQSRTLYLGVQAGNAGNWAVGFGDTAACGTTAVNATQCVVPTVLGTTTQNIPYVWSGAGEHSTVNLATTTTSAAINPVRGVVNPAVQITLTSPSGLQTQVQLSTLGRATACTPAGASHVAGLQTCP